jgi:hypothetical protein
MSRTQPPPGYRWVSNTRNEGLSTYRHRHLLRRGKDQHTTACGSTGLPASLWKPDYRKRDCPACLKAVSKRGAQS